MSNPSLCVPLLPPPSDRATASGHRTFDVDHGDARNGDCDTDRDNDEPVVWMMCFTKLLATGGSGSSSSSRKSSSGDGNVERQLHDDDELGTVEKDSDNKGGRSTPSRDCHYWSGWLVSCILLPLLLWVQLFLALHQKGHIDAVVRSHEQWECVQSGIFCFVIASILYRHAVSERACDSEDSSDEDNDLVMDIDVVLDVSSSTTTATPTIDKARCRLHASPTASSTNTGWWQWCFWLIVSLAPEISTDVILLLVLMNHVVLAIWWMHVSTLVFIASAMVLSMCTCSLRIIPSNACDTGKDMGAMDETSSATGKRKTREWDDPDASACAYGLLHVTIV